MATKTFIGLDKATRDAIQKGISKPIRNSTKYFQTLALIIDQNTQNTFRLEGARAGHSKWKKLSNQTLHPTKMRNGQKVIVMNKWNIRYGTDLSGRPKGSYIPFEKRKGIRRYSSSSKIFQASGGFRKSFKTIAIRNGQLIYGIGGLNMRKLGKDIMSDPERQVIFVTKTDLDNYRKLFVNFVDRGIKF
jgi:hypothetical protein